MLVVPCGATAVRYVALPGRRVIARQTRVPQLSTPLSTQGWQPQRAHLHIVAANHVQPQLKHLHPGLRAHRSLRTVPVSRAQDHQLRLRRSSQPQATGGGTTHLRGVHSLVTVF
jgi:hypothetical protein